MDNLSLKSDYVNVFSLEERMLVLNIFFVNSVLQTKTIYFAVVLLKKKRKHLLNE